MLSLTNHLKVFQIGFKKKLKVKKPSSRISVLLISLPFPQVEEQFPQFGHVESKN